MACLMRSSITKISSGSDIPRFITFDDLNACKEPLG